MSRYFSSEPAVLQQKDRRDLLTVLGRNLRDVLLAITYNITLTYSSAVTERVQNVTPAVFVRPSTTNKLLRFSRSPAGSANSLRVRRHRYHYKPKNLNSTTIPRVQKYRSKYLPIAWYRCNYYVCITIVLRQWNSKTKK